MTIVVDAESIGHFCLWVLWAFMVMEAFKTSLFVGVLSLALAALVQTPGLSMVGVIVAWVVYGLLLGLWHLPKWIAQNWRDSAPPAS